ncbi:MAG: thioredoxin domain-containing protein [Myxococcota bacterium]
MIPRPPRLSQLGRVFRLAGSLAVAAAAFATPDAAAQTAALPGAEAHPPALRAALAGALASLGPDYEPRTRHRRPDGSPRYTNRLLLERSPYLRQHAHNPVDWRPWGDEAFAAARRLDRPVLVSIGYSTCHWCHVMEEETYDDPEVAAVLNAGFIAIKVDREERPDVDSAYMTAVHTLRGTGGWPLNVWVTPEREPFYGATYIPRDDFVKTLGAIRAEWDTGRERLDSSARRLGAVVAKHLAGEPALASWPVDAAPLHAAARSAAARFDPQWGGARVPRKFPSVFPLRFLLRHHRRTGDPDSLRMAVFTLERIAAGGIRDHVGGGFHRYSVDPRWEVPHFEKMLYDNALITLAFVEAWQVTGDARFADVVRSTLDYVAREMTAPGGGFYSATDADSAGPDGEREEGRYFTWTPGELREVLGPEEGARAAAWFGVTEEGDLDGRSVLRTRRPASETASLREKLRAARARRPAPFRDEKILVAWNSLMISAFARAGLAFAEPAWVERAARAADFALSMRRGERLRRLSLDGRAEGPAFLEDYAFLVAGLLDLYEAAPAPRWIREALRLQAVLDADFRDAEGAGYFRSARGEPTGVAREKPVEDAALPSGNGVAALNLLRLAALTGEERHRERALALFSGFHASLDGPTLRAPELAIALDFALDASKEVLLVGPAEGDVEPLLGVLRRRYVPNRVASVVREGAELEAHAEVVPLLRHKKARGGVATAYVCENRTCRFPTSDPAVLEEQLARFRPLVSPAE